MFTHFDSTQTFIEESATRIADACFAREKNRPSYIAFSGGHTPKAIYSYLANTLLPKKDVMIHGYLVDERYVPETDEKSNWRMIQETLLHANNSAIFSFTHIDTSQPIDNSVIHYEKELQRVEEMGFRFELMVLGIGEDGHVASLFPHSPTLFETQKLVAHSKTNDHPISDRITMTFPMILQAKQLLLLAQGPSKKQIIDTLLHKELSIEDCPAKRLLEHNNLHIYYCDAV